MIAQIRSEAYKWATTRSNIGVFAGMVALIGTAILLHAFGLPIARLATEEQQRGILIDVAANVGALFAALLGALSITSEFRTGTIRPTLLAQPRRNVVVAAKVACCLATGAVAAVLAAATAASVARIGLAARGVAFEVTAADVGRLAVGGLVAGALWAAIGLGVGTIVRAQVPTVVALMAWILFVENVLAGDVPVAHKYVPAALAQSLAGSTRDAVLTSAPIAAALLLAYAAIAAILATTALARRDVA
jgi:ABC-type transport system involved in multi-copper enzyme maturation permease subunit